MKNRLISDEKIDEFINKLSESVFDSKVETEDKNLISWELFFDELFMNDGSIDMYNTGAIALGISALCNSGKRNTRYRETIHKATDLLVELRNTDGSWSVTADTSEEQKNGVGSNSVFAIQSLIQAGYFNLNETEPNQLEKNLDYIFHPIKWLYTQRIEKHGADVHYGWGYSGETENKIYIMPTVSVLVTLKMVVRSRRGLLSQSYPIYAITQTETAFLMVKNEKKTIKELMHFRGNVYKALGFVIQVAALLMINKVAFQGVGIPTLVFVSVIAPFSEYLKNWVIRFSKLEE